MATPAGLRRIMEMYTEYFEIAYDKDVYECVTCTLDAYIEDGDRSMIRTIETDPVRVLLEAKRERCA